MCTVSYMYVHVYSSTMIPYCIVYHISIILSYDRYGTSNVYSNSHVTYQYCT